MFDDVQSLAESEPPPRTSSQAAPAAQVDRLMAVAQLNPAAHVAVIGRHTSPFLLALMRCGCAAVRSLRPGAPSPDAEPSDLAWIVDASDERELDDALRAAKTRAGRTGCVVVEGAGYRGRDGFAAIPRHALLLGLDVVAVDAGARRLTFALSHRSLSRSFLAQGRALAS